MTTAKRLPDQIEVNDPRRSEMTEVGDETMGFDADEGNSALDLLFVMAKHAYRPPFPKGVKIALSQVFEV
jgi:hypothetical protein